RTAVISFKAKSAIGSPAKHLPHTKRGSRPRTQRDRKDDSAFETLLAERTRGNHDCMLPGGSRLYYDRSGSFSRWWAQFFSHHFLQASQLLLRRLSRHLRVQRSYPLRTLQ